MTSTNYRSSDYPIDKIFLERWSPRSFTSEEIPVADLATILEAARWAPSSYNSQPWRFLYARRGTEHWPKFLGLLNEFNQSWAGHAAALIIVVSRTTMLPPGAAQEVPAYSHSFDAGAAWATLALQARMSGWDAHAMVGFDIPRTSVELNVPKDMRVEAAVAIGRRGDPSALPAGLAAREQPNDRMALGEIMIEGGF